jgi:hypothetical protein
MEPWRTVWRQGLARRLSSKGLRSLARALASDDPRLLQGVTTMPPPLQCVRSWPVEAACALGYCAWQGDGLETVAEVEEYFARLCFEAERVLGEPAACRWFVSWYDEAPRAEMCRELLEEVRRVLAERRGSDPEQAASHGDATAAA